MSRSKASLRTEHTKKALPYPLWAELLLFAILLILNQLLKSLCAWLLHSAAAAASTPSPAVSLLLTLYATVPATALTLSLYRQLLPPGAKVRPHIGSGTGAKARCYAIGFVNGLLLLFGAVGIGLLTGSLRLQPQRITDPLQWGAFLLGFLLQGFGEEVLFRGYLLLSRANGRPVWVAVCISAAAFAVLHLQNPGISALAFCNLFLFGVLAALYAMRQDHIWGISAVHTAWNFAQGNLFGLSVSGNAIGPAPLRAVLAEDKSLWNGGAFGLEGGLCTTIVLLTGVTVCLFQLRLQTKPKKT